ncbi:MAG: uroporphyrinogen decarboxylase family protein, partial [Planctomycetota bacterium]
EALAYNPLEEAGQFDHGELVELFNRRYREKMADYEDMVYSDGVYITLFSGLIEIFGWDMMLMAAGIDAEGFGEVANRYAQWIQPVFDAFADSDAPVLMSHDDICWTSGPVLHPDWYRTYIFPHYKRFWQPCIDAGKRIVYTSDGTYTEFLDDVVEAGANTLVMEPTTDMAAFAEKYGKTHGFIGNADTRILLSGSKDEIRAEVERCVNIGRDCPGFIMAVGNHIPANTPTESVLYYNEVFEELRNRR